MILIQDISTEKEKQDFFDMHPPKLYKYRVWTNDYHKKVLTNNELFFSSPSLFNDPFDCALPFKQHPDNSDPLAIKKKLEQTSISQFPELKNNPRALEERCAKQLVNILQDPESWFEMTWGYKPEELSKSFGVLSLTPHSNNYLMWSHYADSHQGFCVEFDTRKLVESVSGHFSQVLYGNEIPCFSINDSMEDDLLTKLLFLKSEIWKYEDEYRISRIHKANTPVNFDVKSLTGVYFGCKTTYEQINEIIKIVKCKYPWVKFYKCELDKEYFRLNIEEIVILDLPSC